MNLYGIEINVKNTPKLDPGFIPLLKYNQAFLADAKKPVSIAVERADGQMASCDTFIHGTAEMAEADHYYINRLVKTILWMKGGFKIYVAGDEDIYEYLKYLLEEMPNNNHLEHPEVIDRYLPWSEELPKRCRLKIEKKKYFKN